MVARADGHDAGSPAELQGGAGGLPGSAGGASATGGSTGGGTVELKGGALWWQHLRSSAAGGTAELKYGSNFVLQRPGSVGGAGLVHAVRPPKPVRRSPLPPPLPPVVWRAPGAAASGAGLVLSGSSLASGSVVIDTECFVLPMPGQQQAQQQLPGAIAPNTTCVGIVWQPSTDSQAEAAAPPPVRRGRSSKHPRRTQMLRFTCNLCGETNDCAINPHAWEAGSVFARCEGCTAVHKLKDNLNIFTELVSVFPPRELRDNYLVQEILDKIQENNRN